MNLLPLERGDGGAVSPAPRDRRWRRADCAGSTLGVRPEHIGLALERGVARAVAAIEYLGADSLVTCRLGSTTLAVRVPGSVGLAARRRGAAVVGARRPASVRARRHPERGAMPHEMATHARLESKFVPARGENHALQRAIRRAFAGSPCASPRSLVASFAHAQAPVEVSFYYPVAVGGPITNLIDGYAADFAKENPGIKVKPIYSGTYQDTITKVLTAVKGGEPPVTSILLSTDMFTLIDEDAIVPFDDLIRTPEDPRGSRASTRRSWRTARPAARPGASRSSARRSCSTGTRRCSRRPGSIRTGRRRTGRSRLEYAQKLTRRDASGKVTQWGLQIPS